MQRIIAFLLLFTNFVGEGQLPSSINFTNFNQTNGLPEKNINNIVQDSRGYLWLGSREGLIRFDGLNFKTWYADTGDSLKFSSNNIYVGEEFQPGQLLFASGTEIWQMNIYNHKLKKLDRFAGLKMIKMPVRLGANSLFIAGVDSFFITDNHFNVSAAFATGNYYSGNTPFDCLHLQYPKALLFITGTNIFFLLN